MKVLGILLTAIATAGVVFFGSDHYDNTDAGTLFFFFSLFLYLPALYMLYKHFTSKNAQRLSVLRKPIEEFKKSATVATVDFTNCEILPANHERIKDTSNSMDYRLNFHETLYSKDYVVNGVNDKSFRLVYTLNGDTFVSSPIPLPYGEIADTIKTTGQTNLYFNGKQAGLYYFDIEFFEA